MNVSKNSSLYKRYLQQKKLLPIKIERYHPINLFNNTMSVLDDGQISIYVDIMNILLICHKRKYGKNKKESMFSNLDQSKLTSTNRQMEFYYEEMTTYFKNEKENPDKNLIYEPTEFEDEFKDSKIDEAYFLKIDGSIDKVSRSIYALSIYLASLKDWQSLTWEITPAV